MNEGLISSYREAITFLKGGNLFTFASFIKKARFLDSMLAIDDLFCILMIVGLKVANKMTVLYYSCVFPLIVKFEILRIT